MRKLGVALGGGSAKGLAHIPLLEVIDEFGLKPHQIAGTSIGAVIGVLYASGYTGQEIREGINQMSFIEGDNITEVLARKDIFKWFDYIDIDWKGGALLKADKFLTDLMKDIKGSAFEDLKYPLKVVASDFWKRKQVVFESGELRPAIHASMALPGIFTPVVINDQVLVDGGAVNPVPYDLLDECDIVIAVDVMGNRTESNDLIPTFSEAVFNTFQIMQASILKQKLTDHPPDIYIAPEIVDIKMLEFYKANQIFKQAKPAKDLLRREFEKFLENSV